MAQNNMRKMFTEQQISDIAKSSVSGGTKLYKHTLIVSGNYDGDNRILKVSIYSLFDSPITNKTDFENFMKDDKALSISNCNFYNEDVEVVAYISSINYEPGVGAILIGYMKIDSAATSLDFQYFSESTTYSDTVTPL